MDPIQLIRRYELADRAVGGGLRFAVVLVAGGVAMLAVAVTGQSPVAAARAMVGGSLGSTSALYSTLAKALPTLLAALAWIIAITAGRLNIGMEGQMLIGGVAATAVGIFVTGLPMIVHLPLGIAAGIVGGALYAAIAAWLWARWDVHELLSTLLLNFMAIYLVRWLARHAWSPQPGFLDYSERVADSARWPVVALFGGQISLSVIVVIPVSVAFVAFLLRGTTLGYRLRLVGSNETLARYSGLSPTGLSVRALVMSGGMAGLAGSCLIQGGQTARMIAHFSADHGYEGIVAALLARNGPIASSISAVLFGALRQGSVVMEVQAGVSAALALTTVALVILLITLTEYVLRRRELRRVDAKPDDRSDTTSLLEIEPSNDDDGRPVQAQRDPERSDEGSRHGRL